MRPATTKSKASTSIGQRGLVPDADSDSQAGSLEYAIPHDDNPERAERAEHRLVAAFLRFGGDCKTHVAGLEQEHVFDLNLRSILSASLAVIESGPFNAGSSEIFLELVVQELDRRGMLAAVGGHAFVCDLWLHQGPPVPELVAHYAALVRQAWCVRHVLQELSQAEQLIVAGANVVESVNQLWGRLSTLEGPWKRDTIKDDTSKWDAGSEL